jgi:PLP dependent protein
MQNIASNLHDIRRRIETAARAATRDPESIALIAVSKGKTEDDVRAAIAAGQRIFGENRVQEARAKYADLRAAYPDIELHLIGLLQTNKAEEAVKLFDVIETLDRPALAEALARATQKTGRAPRLYVEVNIGAEPQKTGVMPGELDGFLSFCRTPCGLTVSGLMCIPPRMDDPTPYFSRMKELADRYGMPHLSMGMSADFAIAIRCGATAVRIGTAIFGVRA